MATTNNTSYTESQIQGAPFGINQTFQSILSEYQDPQWFKNMIFDPFKYIRVGGKMTGWKDPMAKAGYRTSEALESTTLGQFAEFSTREWETADYVTGIAKENLDAQLDLRLEQSEEEFDLDTRIYEEQRDKKIDEAESQMKNTLVNQDTSKALIRQRALDSISQIDSLIAHSGIKSGSYDKKKTIALDAVQTDLEKANLTKAMSVRDYNLAKVAADRDFDFNIEKATLVKDQQYDTGLLNKEQKQQTLGLNLVADKIDIYEQWKTNQVETANEILGSEEHLYGTDEDRLEAFETGGAEYEIMKEQYTDFSEDWDLWKHKNKELYEDMLANPEEYGIETTTRTWSEAETRYTDFLNLPFHGEPGVGLDFFGSTVGESTPAHWDYSAASDAELDANIMNNIFLTGQGAIPGIANEDKRRGDWTREEYGEWSPWMALTRGGEQEFGDTTASQFIGSEWDFLLDEI